MKRDGFIGNEPVMIFDMSSDLDACFSCKGENIGMEETMLVICDEYSICDTTYLFTEVREANEIESNPAEEIFVYSGFSPNGDGINDHFRIDGLENIDQHQLSIFNRWGTTVFKSQDYQNDWKGTYDGSVLPIGTYFYVLQINSVDKQSGYVQISR